MFKVLEEIYCFEPSLDDGPRPGCLTDLHAEGRSANLSPWVVLFSWAPSALAYYYTGSIWLGVLGLLGTVLAGLILLVVLAREPQENSGWETFVTEQPDLGTSDRGRTDWGISVSGQAHWGVPTDELLAERPYRLWLS